jgi:hypothetical protein
LIYRYYDNFGILEQMPIIKKYGCNHGLLILKSLQALGAIGCQQ